MNGLSFGRASAWFASFLLAISLIAAIAFLGAHFVREYYPSYSDSGWAQAIGAVVAILIGFAGVIYQVEQTKITARLDSIEAGRAAHLIAFDALETVTERLEAALTPNKQPTLHRLRGLRTTEMVNSLREFDTSRLPASMLTSFIRLRSRVFAINSRISELYAVEDSIPAGSERQAIIATRRNSLYSSVMVWQDAVGQFTELDTIVTASGSQSQQITRPNLITMYAKEPPQIGS